MRANLAPISTVLHRQIDVLLGYLDVNCLLLDLKLLIGQILHFLAHAEQKFIDRINDILT